MIIVGSEIWALVCFLAGLFLKISQSPADTPIDLLQKVYRCIH